MASVLAFIAAALLVALLLTALAMMFAPAKWFELDGDSSSEDTGHSFAASGNDTMPIAAAGSVQSESVLRRRNTARPGGEYDAILLARLHALPADRFRSVLHAAVDMLDRESDGIDRARSKLDASSSSSSSSSNAHNGGASASGVGDGDGEGVETSRVDAGDDDLA